MRALFICAAGGHALYGNFVAALRNGAGYLTVFTRYMGFA